MHKIPPEVWTDAFLSFFSAFPNNTKDFSKPYLKKSVSDIYYFFIILYGALIIIGVLSNTVMIYYLLRRRLCTDHFHGLLLNVAICGFVMSSVVLPISLPILIIQNWVFGKFLCYFIPMIQDAPIHATMLSFVFISLRRFRVVVMPKFPRISQAFALATIWVISSCAVITYISFMDYLSLREYLGPEQGAGVGICVVDLVNDNSSKYIKAIFAILYIIPLLLIIYLHARIVSKMKNILDGRSGRRRSPQSPYNSTRPETSNWISVETTGRHMINSTEYGGRMQIGPTAGAIGLERQDQMSHFSISRRGFDEEFELDLIKEKIEHRCTVIMVTVFALCICPLLMLRIVKNLVSETYANLVDFDMTYIIFVWIAFLPTISTPGIFYAWKLYSALPEEVLSAPSEEFGHRVQDQRAESAYPTSNIDSVPHYFETRGGSGYLQGTSEHAVSSFQQPGGPGSHFQSFGGKPLVLPPPPSHTHRGGGGHLTVDSDYDERSYIRSHSFSVT